MAEENRLIKQAVNKTYNNATGVLVKAMNKTLIINPDDRVNNHNRLSKVQKVLGLA